MKRFTLFLTLLLAWRVAFSQSSSIQGTVTDKQSGAPLPGVTVRIRGASVGTQTDAQGRFMLPASGEVTLDFSYVGYSGLSMTANGSQPLKVSMEQGENKMNELVVVGYGEIRKTDLTGAVGSLGGDQVAARGSLSPMEAIEGQVPGVDISANSGRAGTGYRIQIRGQNSLEGGTPLYVVDGVLVNNIDFLNPQDIERVDILKDASSAAIYGSRGSNGVVIITTRQAGSAKGATITYDGYIGIRKLARMPDFMNGDQWWEYRQDAYISDALQKGTPYDETIGGIDASPLLAKRVANKEYYFWPDYFIRTGVQNNHWLTVSGRNDNKLSYVIGAGYQNEKGNLIRESYERYNFKVSVSQQLNERWAAGTSMNISVAEQELGSDLAITNAFRMSPLVGPYDTTGQELLFQPAKYAGISFTSSVNPLWEQKDSRNNTRSFIGIGNLYLQYSPVKWISLRSTISPRIRYERNGRYYGSHTESRQLEDPAATSSKSESLSYTWDNQINVHRTFGEHDINFLGLYSMYYARDEFSDIAVENLPYNSLYYNLGTAQDYQRVASGFSKVTLISYIARLNYTWKDKYLVTLSNRWDGSSKLAPGHKWKSFPSAALAWRLSQEPFLAPAKFISDLKVRLSVGFTGNNNIDPYATQALSSTQTYYDFGGSLAKGYAPNGIVNQRLTWERTREINAGVDFALWKGRVSGAIDAYNKLSHDLLMTRKLPLETGWGSMVDNVGSVRNKGIEVSLHTVNIHHGDFRWETTFNFSKNRNEIVELFGKREDYVGNAWFIGQPIHVNYTYVFDGIWQENDKDRALSYGQTPGQARVKDFNGDNQINGDDRRIIGSPDPSWTGGFSTRLSYKGFDFSGSLYTRQGVQVRSGFYGEFTNVQDRGRAKLDMNYYMPANDVTPARASNEYPEPHNAGPYWSEVGYYRDASFVKVKNLTLGYQVPSAPLHKAGIQSLRLYINVLNPFVFTDYGGFDPEWADADFGDGGNSFVTYQFGVNLSF